jgi:hypothetical protein
MRVTANQALIVATGSAIEETDHTDAPGSPGFDALHAGQPECSSCHSTLDPTRSILAATWSWNYHPQRNDKFASQPGAFAFREVVKPMKSIGDFAETLATHPLVAPAWAQKLCYYVNSAPCDEHDPEFSRIVELFRSSHFSWNALVKALVTSPLTTYAADSATRRANGETVAVLRRDHFCAALDSRLGLVDACGRRAGAPRGSVGEIVSGLPSDAYGRGAVAPVLPNDPTLFFSAGMRNICESVATQVIDGPVSEARHWSSAEPTKAISDFVTIVMGLAASDARNAKANALLSSHFQAALAVARTTPTDALRSTFVAACASPSAISVGL